MKLMVVAAKTTMMSTMEVSAKRKRKRKMKNRVSFLRF